MADIDLSQLSAAELEQLQKEAANRLERVREEERQAVFAKIEDLAKSLGLSRADLVAHYGAKRRATGKKAAPKYRNLNDSAQTWTGRGRKPAWVTEHLAKGGTLDQLAISSA